MKLNRGANLWVFLVLLLATALLPNYAGGTASEMKLQAKLVWGTNGGKPSDAKLKELDDGLKERLQKVFKWQNYYEVNHHDFSVPSSGDKSIEMSPKCRIEVRNEGDNQIEVKLIGEGKPVVKKRQMINGHELLILGGDSKNDTAWFVVIQRAE